MDTQDKQVIQELIGADLRDSLDEELELELDDQELDQFISARPVHPQHPPLDRASLFQRAVPPAARVGEAAGLGPAQQAQGRRDFRRPRLRRQGRRHQAHHPAAQSARLPRRRPARADRARTNAMVFPALCAASAGRRRNRAVRPLLVQPRRRRARHGLCRPTSRSRSSSAPCPSSSACWCAPASSWSNTGSRSPTRSSSSAS